MTSLPPPPGIVRDALNCRKVSDAFVRFASGSHEASCSGYPTHLTRYWVWCWCCRWSRMYSTSYSRWSSMDTAGGEGGGGSWLAMLVGSLYGLKRETWKTGWILRDGGRSNLRATEDTFWRTR